MIEVGEHTDENLCDSITQHSFSMQRLAPAVTENRADYESSLERHELVNNSGTDIASMKAYQVHMRFNAIIMKCNPHRLSMYSRKTR
jgi:hypothetical protein